MASVVVRSRWSQPVEVRDPAGWRGKVSPDECLTVPADVYDRLDWPDQQWTLVRRS